MYLLTNALYIFNNLFTFNSTIETLSYRYGVY